MARLAMLRFWLRPQATLRLGGERPGKIRFDLCDVFSIELLDGWRRIHFQEGQRSLERKKQ
jgi:hypothetical protein